MHRNPTPAHFYCSCVVPSLSHPLQSACHPTDAKHTSSSVSPSLYSAQSRPPVLDRLSQKALEQSRLSLFSGLNSPRLLWPERSLAFAAGTRQAHSIQAPLCFIRSGDARVKEGGQTNTNKQTYIHSHTLTPRSTRLATRPACRLYVRRCFGKGQRVWLRYCARSRRNSHGMNSGRT